MDQKGTVRIIVLAIIVVMALVVGAFFFISSRFRSFPGQSEVALKEQDLAQVKEECNKAPIIPQDSYQGLLTDVHVHTMPTNDHIEAALGLLEEMNQSGIDRVVVQSSHMPKGASIASQLDQTWGKISSVCPRIITLLYGFNPDEKDAWKYVAEQLNTGNYGGVGEIEFQHSNLPIKHDPESESMIEIYQMLNEKGLALHFQADLRKDPSLGPKLVKIIKNYPKIKFIWFGGCRLDGEFSKLSNLYCDTFLNSRSRPQDQATLAKSIIGSDASPPGMQNPGYQFLPYQSVGEAASQARVKLQTLPKDVAGALSRGNFDKIWPK